MRYYHMPESHPNSCQKWPTQKTYCKKLPKVTWQKAASPTFAQSLYFTMGQHMCPLKRAHSSEGEMDSYLTHGSLNPLNSAPKPAQLEFSHFCTADKRYQKGKTNLDFTEARDNEWQTIVPNWQKKSTTCGLLLEISHVACHGVARDMACSMLRVISVAIGRTQHRVQC